MKSKLNKISKIIINNFNWILLFIIIVVILRMIIVFLKDYILKIDINFYNFIVNNIRNESLTKIMMVITILGGGKVILLSSLILFVIIKNKKIGLYICANPIIVTIINQVLKGIVGRKRPNQFFLIIEKGFSFPSGHSMVSTAFYGLIIYLLYNYCKNKKIKYMLITPLIILIPLIMFSRIYLGVHYLSDVIAGFLISVVYLILYIKLINKNILKGGKINLKD